METLPMSIDWQWLDAISYRTCLGKSLKNTLRKFDKSDLFQEINDIIAHFTEKEHFITSEHRIKSLQSCILKYDKYYPHTEVEKAFNDILGIRITIDDYNIIDNMLIPQNVKIADMRNGKAKDDGYRAIHMYYQKDHYHYPIEVQFMTLKDKNFNEWLHVYLYKYTSDNTIGIKLKTLYDANIIQSKEDFRKELCKLCVI